MAPASSLDVKGRSGELRAATKPSRLHWPASAPDLLNDGDMRPEQQRWVHTERPHASCLRPTWFHDKPLLHHHDAHHALLLLLLAWPEEHQPVAPSSVQLAHGLLVSLAC